MRRAMNILSADETADGEVAGNTIPCNNNKQSRYSSIPFCDRSIVMSRRSEKVCHRRKSEKERSSFTAEFQKKSIAIAPADSADCNACRRCVCRAAGQGVERSNVKLLAIIIHRRESCLCRHGVGFVKITQR